MLRRRDGSKGCATLHGSVAIPASSLPPVRALRQRRADQNFCRIRIRWGAHTARESRQTSTGTATTTNYRRHNFIFGGDFRRQEFNEFGQQNPRGTFAFTGAATQAGGSSSSGGASTTTGSDLADFLLGIPDTSAISYGNPDKYFRQSVYDLYFTDDWRMLPQ